MKRFFKIALFLLVMLIGLGGLAIYWTFYRPLPEYDTSIRLNNLHQPVKIYWGSYGVPHIYAQDKHDLYLALGYVHAQDRLWQMTLSQLAVQGRFAEFFGKGLLPIDKFQRTIGFWRIAQKVEKQLPDSLHRILEAYATGVNQYVAQHKKTLPLQFALTGIEPIHWTPTHTLALTRLMAWQLNTAWAMELNYTLLSRTLSAKKFNRLFPNHSIPVPVDTTQKTTPDSLAAMLRPLVQLQKKYEQLMNIDGNYTGSNAWAADGSRTQSGEPLLAGDPHLGLFIPGKWYEVHLHVNGKNLSGATIPGAPAVVLGQNDVLAWSFTNVMLDDTDFYKELLHPADSTKYLADSLGKKAIYKPFIVQHEVIEVKDAQDVIFTRRLTKHGPVISEIFSNQLTLSNNAVITMQWTGQKSSREFLALQQMGWATSFNEFKQAIKKFKVPAQNVVYADTAGNIALFTLGRVPKRKGNPLLLRPGWKPKYDWQGVVPFSELPKIVNPKKGWVANANNPVAKNGTPYYLSAYWATDSRYSRIKQYLANNNQLTVQAFQVMQYDVHSTYAEKLVQLIMPVLEQQQNEFSTAIEYLQNWDFSYKKTESAAAILDIFKIKLSKNIFADEMGSQNYHNFINFSAKPAQLLLRFLRADSSIIHSRQLSFFNNIHTPGLETPDEVIQQSMEEAIGWLHDHYGAAPTDWRWEEVHQLTLKPPFFGQAAEREDASPVLKLIVENVMSRGPFGVPGTGVTINAGGYSWHSPFQMTAGPSIRRIIDLSNMNRSLSILPTGQSGNPLSPYYGDQTRNWINDQYKYLYQDRSLFVNYSVMTLKPVN